MDNLWARLPVNNPVGVQAVNKVASRIATLKVVCKARTGRELLGGGGIGGDEGVCSMECLLYNSTQPEEKRQGGFLDMRRNIFCLDALPAHMYDESE